MKKEVIKTVENSFEFPQVMEKLVGGQELTKDDVGGVIGAIASGEMSDVQIAGFDVALLMKGPTTKEIAHIAEAMREVAIPVRPNVEGPMIDTCGTGGGQTTFNISTANAIVTAAEGVKVAKHGSNSISSKCGSADVLQELGVNINLDSLKLEKLIEEAGIGFIYANLFHPVMGRVFGPENELGIKTIFFTIIGPLISPANVKRHVLGVNDPNLVEPVAEVANQLGFEHALIVHGVDGLDEISLLGPTQIAEVKNGEVKTYEVSPENFGMKRCQIEDIDGGTPEENAQMIRDIFSGEDQGPRKDIVVLNAAASFLVAGKVESLQDGVEMARGIIERGKAMAKLEELIQVSNSF